MDNFQIRTDLALEARESVNEEESKLRGVSVEEHYEEEADLRITKVTIDTKNAEKMLGILFLNYDDHVKSLIL